MGEKANIFDQPEWRNRRRVFRDRAHAGGVLAVMLRRYRESGARLLAIPAGGVPVAAVVAAELSLPLDAAVVSKITLPWSTESGYGAVAFDGSLQLNGDLIRRLALPPQTVQEGIARTREKVRRRHARLRGARPPLEFRGATAIVVDDGLASGVTMQVAIAALHRAGAREVVVAVPTGHEESVARVAQQADAVFCANVRGGGRFAVADAYEQWSDVSEDEAARLLAAAAARSAPLPA